jgi:hypothetical protein
MSEFDETRPGTNPGDTKATDNTAKKIAAAVFGREPAHRRTPLTRAA